MNTTEVHDDPFPFADFAPTLSQCFVIVIVGYIMARFEIFNSSDLKGVNAFAAYIAMPGIICVSLMDAKFEDFRWELLFGIFLGKFLIFLLVAALFLLLDDNIGVAGTVALFCVQSNDLPVGNPLMSSLYRHYRPQMMKYLFLIPAMTTIFFVPITNIMISVHRAQRSNKQKSEVLAQNKTFWQYVHSKEHLNHIRVLVKNPVVIATLLGLVLNAVFQEKIPEVLHRPIQVAAATIPGIALALLGFSFIRKERYLISSAFVPAMALLILKMVITPILSHTILKLLTEESTSSKLLSDFALLYGIISPATAVFQSGQEFRKPLAAMSVALILTSLSSFPLSYFVARITIAPVYKLSSYVPLLKRSLLWIASASIFSDVVVCLTMVRKKQWHKALGCYISYLVFTQCLTSCGVLFWSLTDNEMWGIYCQMALYYGGEISGYIWTGTIAVVLILKEKYTMLFEKGFAILSFSAFSVSLLITTAMCLLISHNNVKRVYVVGRARSNFELLQLVMTTILLFISLAVVSGSLIYHFKRRKTIKVTDIQGYENKVFYMQDEDLKICLKKEFQSPLKQQENLGENEEAKFYYHEMLRRCGCENNLSAVDREWTNQLCNLMLMQGLVMLVRFIANLFKLIRSKALEIMIPMEFLQSALFIGQGIFLLFIFGIDLRTITISLRKWCRKIRVGGDEISSNIVNKDPEDEVVQFCSQFYTFYSSRCFEELAKERRWKDNVYVDSFWGHQFVDWMISQGLCKDDTEAEGVGQKLLTGGIIKHVTERHHFYDAPYLYCFVRRKSGM